MIYESDFTNGVDGWSTGGSCSLVPSDAALDLNFTGRGSAYVDLELSSSDVGSLFAFHVELDASYSNALNIRVFEMVSGSLRKDEALFLRQTAGVVSFYLYDYLSSTDYRLEVRNNNPSPQQVTIRRVSVSKSPNVALESNELLTDLNAFSRINADLSVNGDTLTVTKTGGNTVHFGWHINAQDSGLYRIRFTSSNTVGVLRSYLTDLTGTTPTSSSNYYSSEGVNQTYLYLSSTDIKLNFALPSAPNGHSFTLTDISITAFAIRPIVEVLDLESPVPQRKVYGDDLVTKAGSSDVLDYLAEPPILLPIRELSLCRSDNSIQYDVMTWDVLDTTALQAISSRIEAADVVVGHNVIYDLSVLNAALTEAGMNTLDVTTYDTMRESTLWMNLRQRGNEYGSYKWPTLGELYQRLTGRCHFANHDSAEDARVCAECYWELLPILE